MDNHETVFESRAARVQRGAKVDGDYVPLADQPELNRQVVHGEARVGGRARRPIDSSTGLSTPAGQYGGVDVHAKQISHK